MTERLLQFIWQFRYFNPRELCTGSGERLQILSPGELNTNQGPDFLQAEIRIDNTVWVGNIELHLLTSGWERHAHAGDRNYDNVILHVVWEDDRESKVRTRADGDPITGKNPIPGRGAEGCEKRIPLLVLQHRVPKLLLGKYEEWMKSRSFVPCAGQLSQTEEALWSGWKEQLLIRRLQRKTLLVAENLQQNRQHWEQTAWWLMARNFGIPVNTDAFGSIARSLPLRILSRHRHLPEQLEALLLGQAGLLEGRSGEDYPKSLREEFRHLRGKYHLPPIHAPLLFMRMRPANFPSVRLVQLAGLLQRSCSWFGSVREADSVQELMELLGSGRVGNDRETPERRSALSTRMKENILINTFLPLLFAYGSLRGEDRYRERALRWMKELRPEKNNRTAGWVKLGVSNRHAADSQALLELKTCYCDERKCLECAIGRALLGPVP